ncbi:MAG: glucosamine--fructose-6-phosphate aminotransferase, partial [Chloroflexi bacterium]|nr:glucosamine--fructose-6-phosphate aminotransferase [Chloroflexota bacterium]
MSRLLQEIMEQPSVLEGLLNTEYGVIQEVAAAIRERHVRAVLIAARGTSDNAATYAKYLWGAFNGLPVMLAAPSLYT